MLARRQTRALKPMKGVSLACTKRKRRRVTMRGLEWKHCRGEISGRFSKEERMRARSNHGPAEKKKRLRREKKKMLGRRNLSKVKA